MTLRLMVGTLYLLGTAALVGRSMIEGVELSNYIAVAMNRQLIPQPTAWPLYARASVVLIGTIGSIIYLFGNNAGYGARDDT